MNHEQALRKTLQNMGKWTAKATIAFIGIIMLWLGTALLHDKTRIVEAFRNFARALLEVGNSTLTTFQAEPVAIIVILAGVLMMVSALWSQKND